MATKETYTGNGSQVDFAIPFPYLARDHVKVYLNGVLTTAWTFFNAGTVRMNVAPAVGAILIVKRETPTTPLVSFTNGTGLPAADINKASRQALYVSEESSLTATEAMHRNNPTNVWDAKGSRIALVGNAVFPTDAVNKGQMDAVDAALDAQVDTAVADMNTAVADMNTALANAVATVNNSFAAAVDDIDDRIADSLTELTTIVANAETAATNAAAAAEAAETAIDNIQDDIAAAQTAATNATTAATNAQQAADDAVAATASKVNKSGDTMTGALTLPNANPTDANHAARKAYVDAGVAAATATANTAINMKVSKTGDIMSGALTVGNAASSNVWVNGGAIEISAVGFGPYIDFKMDNPSADYHVRLQQTGATTFVTNVAGVNRLTVNHDGAQVSGRLYATDVVSFGPLFAYNDGTFSLAQSADYRYLNVRGHAHMGHRDSTGTWEFWHANAERFRISWDGAGIHAPTGHVVWDGQGHIVLKNYFMSTRPSAAAYPGRIIHVVDASQCRVQISSGGVWSRPTWDSTLEWTAT